MREKRHRAHCGKLAAVAISLAAGSLRAEDFVLPLDAVVDNEDIVYVVDRRLPGVWRSTDAGYERLIEGAKRFREPLNAPRCVALDGNGRLLVGDSATREVYRVDEKGGLTGLTSQPEQPGVIGIPNSIAVDAKGVIYVADLESHRIWRVPAGGGKPEEFAVVRGPRGLAFDDDGRLWVSCHGDNQVLRFTPDGKAEVVVQGQPFRFPNGIAVVGTTAYVADGYGKAVFAVEPGKAPRVIHSGKPFANPVGIERVGKELLVVDSRERRAFRMALDGTIEK